MKSGIIAVASFLAFNISSTLYASDDRTGIDQIVDRYLAAYKKLDSGSAKPLLAQDFRFIDPTSESLESPFITYGREAVLQKWRDYLDTVDEHIFILDIERRYSYSGHVVLIGKGGWRSVANGTVSEARMPFVTVISVQDGMIVEHRDYVDYETGFASWNQIDQATEIKR